MILLIYFDAGVGKVEDLKAKMMLNKFQIIYALPKYCLRK